MRFFVQLSFKGTNYHGWQIQQNASSVQQTLESAMSLLLGEQISVIGCGRTDTGVHARDFWAHFDYEGDANKRGEWCYKINAILPSDIVVHGFFLVPEQANARFSASERTYRYFIRTKKDPFLDAFSSAPGTYGQKQLNIPAMEKAASLLLGTHDFTSFSKLHTQTLTNICTITSARWFSEGPLLVFEISADRFLRNMVRAIVGSLLEIGFERKPVEWILQVVAQKNRCKAGHSVPPEGLFLWNVKYENLNL